MCTSVKEFKATLKEIWKYGEVISWPYRNIILSKEILQQYYSDYSNAINSCLNSNCLPKVGPSGLVRSFDILIKAMKYSKKEKNRELVNDVLKILSEMKENDILNLTGSNVIYGLKEIKESYENASDISSDIVHRITALIKSYSELMYFRSYEISQEIHGPYNLDSSKLIVWNYHNLRPISLIDEEYLLPYNSIVIKSIYNNYVDIKLDLYNHDYNKGENFRENFKMGSIEVDNKLVDEDELLKLEKLLISKIQKLYFRYKKLNDDEYIQAYINTLWYKLTLISSTIDMYKIEDKNLAIISDSKDVPTIDQRMISLLF